VRERERERRERMLGVFVLNGVGCRCISCLSSLPARRAIVCDLDQFTQLKLHALFETPLKCTNRQWGI
jgi:hypothetical protein